MSKYKVIDASRSQFTVGEIVTKVSKDCSEYRFFAAMAAGFGLSDDPEFQKAEPFRDEQGRVQVLSPDEVELIS